MTVSYNMNRRIPVTRHIYNPPGFKERSRCEPLIDTDICYNRLIPTLRQQQQRLWSLTSKSRSP